MDRSTELQISAQTNGDMVQAAFHRTDRKQICQSLGGMLMTSIACIDHRDLGSHRTYQRRAFLWMAHGADVCVT